MGSQPEKADSNDTVFLFNIGPQENEGLEDMIFDGAFGDIQLLRDLFVGKSFVPAHFEDLLSSGRQQFDTAGNGFGKLFVFDAGVRGMQPAFQVIGRRFSGGQFGFECIDSPIAGHPVDIAGKIADGRKFCSLLPDTVENVLGNFFCEPGVFDVQQAVAVDN